MDVWTEGLGAPAKGAGVLHRNIGASHPEGRMVSRAPVRTPGAARSAS